MWCSQIRRELGILIMDRTALWPAIVATYQQATPQAQLARVPHSAKPCSPTYAEGTEVKAKHDRRASIKLSILRTTTKR